VYECGDGEYVSVAALEPQFHSNFVALVAALGLPGLAVDDLPFEQRMDLCCARVSGRC
jgi:crotonobetainyl-CoA:carnitine CoA-transferase CaiB-like acyl-CoA transferase